jgi:hypothetical protein
VVRKDGIAGKVGRVRGHEANQYFVDAKKFSAIGKDIPEEVLHILNLDKINVQRQLDLPYLLLDPSGEVALTFNKFTNLDQIDKLILLIGVEMRDAQAGKKFAEETLAKLSEELKKFESVDNLEALVGAFEEVDKEIQEKTAKESRLTEAADTIVEVKAERDSNLSRLTDCNILLSKLLAKRDDLVAMKASIDAISKCRDDCLTLASNIRSTRGRIDEINKYLPGRIEQMDSLKKAVVHGRMLEEVEGSISQVSLKRSRVCNLRDIVDSLSGQLDVLDENTIGHRVLLDDARKELASVDICILCGQKLATDEAKATMLANVRKA